MNENPGNSNSEPLSIKRRQSPREATDVTHESYDATGQADGQVEVSLGSSMTLKGRSEVATVTRYSSASDIRDPLRLFSNIAVDFYRGRELAWRLFVRNLRGMYRQTFLGLFWVFLPPVLNTAFWVFLRNSTDVLNKADLEINYTVFILTGMIFWQSFIESFQMPLNMLNKNRNMISKLNFPRESLLLVGLGEVLFDLVIRLLLLVPTFLWFGVGLQPSMLLVPLALLGLILLGAGLGLLILPVGSLYQDVGRFIAVALPFWMILTPIIYPPLEGSILNWVNPACPLLVVARDWTLVGSTDFVHSGWAYGLSALPLFLLGLIVYRVSIPVLIERMTA